MDSAQIQSQLDREIQNWNRRHLSVRGCPVPTREPPQMAPAGQHQRSRYCRNKGGNPSTRELQKQGIAIRDFGREAAQAAEKKEKQQERVDAVNRAMDLRANGVAVRDFAVEEAAKKATEEYYKMKDRMEIQGIEVKDFAGEP